MQSGLDLLRAAASFKVRWLVLRFGTKLVSKLKLELHWMIIRVLIQAVCEEDDKAVLGYSDMTVALCRSS